MKLSTIVAITTSIFFFLLYLFHQFKCLMLLVRNHVDMDPGEIIKVSGLPHYWQWFTCILTPVADVEEGRCPIFLVTLHMPQDWAPPVKSFGDNAIGHKTSETFSVVSITRPWQAATTSQVGFIKAFHPGRICSLNCFTRIVLDNRGNNL